MQGVSGGWGGERESGAGGVTFRQLVNAFLGMLWVMMFFACLIGWWRSYGQLESVLYMICACFSWEHIFRIDCDTLK
jgi:hypothetical protein